MKNIELGYVTGYSDGSAFWFPSIVAALRHPSSRHGISVVYGSSGGPRIHRLSRAEINSDLEAELARRWKSRRRP